MGNVRIKQSQVQPVSKKDLQIIQKQDKFKQQSDLSNVTQQQIKEQLPIQLQQQIFSLTLPTSSYHICYNQIGSHALVASNHGHIFIINLQRKIVQAENKLDDHIVDCCFLANQNLIAIAFGTRITIFDSNLLQLHNWPSQKPIKLCYLPYHMILVSICPNYISYIDITSGKEVAKLEPESQILYGTVNPENALIGVITIQNQNTIQWFAPSQKLPIMAINCQFAINKFITYKNILIAYNQKQIKFYQISGEIGLINQINSFYAIQDIEVSQTGVLAILQSGQIISSQFIGFYKIQDLLQERQLDTCLYMKEQSGFQYASFRPYYDNFCYTTITGFHQIFIPQSCIREIDTYDSNVFQTNRQRGESEIKQQLQKVSWELIGNNYLQQTKKLSDEEKVNKKYGQIFQYMEGKQNNKSQKSAKAKQKMKDQKTVAKIIQKQEIEKQQKKKTDWNNKFFGRQTRQ